MTYRQRKEEFFVLYERFEALLAGFPADERDVLLGAMEHGQIPPAVLVRLAAARRRASGKAKSDARTDHARRLLVGARLPRQTAERYRSCARERGLSLYRFVCQALEREYLRLTK